MKKFLITLMCVVMIIAMMPAMAFAEETAAAESDDGGQQLELAPANDGIINTEGELQAAINNGGTVVLGGDVTVENGITVTANTTVVLDLAGHTISQTKECTGSYAMIANDGTLTITGNGKLSFTDTGAGDPKVGWASYAIRNAGTLIVENGTIEHLGTQTYNGNNAIFHYSGSTTINGGTISAPYSRSLRVWHGNATINNGTFDGQVWVQAMSDCELTINDGSFKPATYGKDGSSIFVTNDTHNPTLSVTGGEVATKIGCSNASKLAGCITGGSFSESAKADTNKALLSSGVAFGEADETGYCIIVPAADSVAKIGNVGYPTLQEAINAADGKTVTLIDNTDLTDVTISIPQNAAITLDLNAKTLTGKATNASTSNFIKVNRGASLVLSNGTISFLATKPDTEWGGEGQPPYPGYASNTIRNEGNLTINNVTIENKTGRGGASYVVDNYAGADLTVNNGAVIKQTGGDIAIRMFAGSATDPIDVTINGGHISGYRAIWVQLTGSDNNVAPDANVIVNGGTLESTDSTYNQAIYSYTFGNSFAATDITIINGTFNGDVAFTGGATKNPTETVTVSGGTFTNIYSYGEMNPFITSGTFAENPKVYVKSGNVYKYNNGTYEVAATAPNNTKDYVWSASPNADGIYTESYVAPYIPPVDPTPAPSTPKDDVVTNETTNTGAAGETVVAPTTNADVSASTTTTKTETGEAKTETKVEQTTADKIVENAVANKSEEVVIDATTAPAPTTGTTGTTTTTPAAETTEAAVTIPTKTIETIATETDAAVTIKTDVAEIKLDNTAAAAIAEQAADDGTISIVAVKTDEVVVEEETVTGETERVTEVHFELKVVCSERGVIGDFQGGTVTVTVPVPQDMHTEELVAVYIDAQGHYHRVTGVKNANGTFTFTTDHFSSYAVMTAEEAEAAIAAQKEVVEDIKFKLSSKLVKRANGKKSVKLTWSDADVEFEGIEIQRSLKKNSGYGKKAYFTIKEGAESYTNTAVKKGTRYYYRARGFVTIDGEKVYTDWSYKAWRKVK
ncbi:MAG: hypothetical protein IJB73_08255 [Firmicutes bacterium]|nr:hypothetical protein [Bacillota bacterium]